MKKPIISLNLYLPSLAKKKAIKRKAKAAHLSPSKFLVKLADAVPDPTDE